MEKGRLRVSCAKTDMIYHTWRTLSKFRPYSGREVVAEQTFCDACWYKEIRERFSKASISHPGREEHVPHEERLDERCDNCQPTEI
jgi:hypothetical protein